MTLLWRWIGLGALLCILFSLVLTILAFLATGSPIVLGASDAASILLAGLLAPFLAGLIVTHASGRILEPVIGCALAMTGSAIIQAFRSLLLMRYYDSSLDIPAAAKSVALFVLALALGGAITALGGWFGRRTGGLSSPATVI